MIAKFLAFEALVAATAFDAQAQRIVLIAAAIGAAGLLWRTIVKPLGRLIHSGVAVVKRTAEAVDVLEHLPERWREVDERVANVEAEVGIAHNELATLDGKVVSMANDVAAIRREFGISDDQVRRPDSRPYQRP